MALAVIGAGFGRTGTMSLKKALEQLGLGPCHHMEEVLANPAQLPYWQAAAGGGPVDWNATFAGYGSAVDWPSAHYWRQLAAFYPDAKVILSVRPAERWWQSFETTIAKVLAMRDTIPAEHARAVTNMAHEIIARQTFGDAYTDKAVAIRAFERRIQDVRAALPPERLLVFDVAEGWGPLCAFLGRPVPEGPFPRTNSTPEFWELIRGATGG